MRKMFKMLAAAGMMILAGTSFQSCSDDDGMDSTLRIYQQYEVLVNGEEKSASANFRIGGVSGDRIQLTNGTEVFVNGLTMWYSEPESATEPEYLYAVALDGRHKKATFVFTRSKGIDLTNEIEFDYILPIGVPEDLTAISNGKPVTLSIPEPLRTDLEYRATLTGGTSQERTYTGVVDVINSCAMFSGVPNGNYLLTVDVATTVATTANDGNAGGSIKLIRRTQKRSVKIED